MSEVVTRRAARVLLIDAEGRVLLLRGFDPRTPDLKYWFTVGGGLESGETAAQAAARELAEETGVRVDPVDLVGPVYQDLSEFPVEGRWYRQENRYFAVRVDSCEVDTRRLAETELVGVDGHRWWSADELDTTAETYYPMRLPALLRSLAER